MTLSFVHKSLLEAPERVIAHGCNLKGAMGRGVALAVKERWPKVYTTYQYACVSGGLYIGAVNWAERAPDLWIANVITQNQYGKDPKLRYASYDGIDRGMRSVVTEGLETGRVTVGDDVALPMIGCSNGNARWPVVSSILEQISDDTGVNFKIYELDKAKIERVTGALAG